MAEAAILQKEYPLLCWQNPLVKRLCVSVVAYECGASKQLAPHYITSAPAPKNYHRV